MAATADYAISCRTRARAPTGELLMPAASRHYRRERPVEDLGETPAATTEKGRRETHALVRPPQKWPSVAFISLTIAYPFKAR